ncbi:MAG: beta-N-acetylhexosaminidase [Myxococcales bacterium]|nr:beta-N-acetylhexosaminidase [Myxococcales bacterium]
MDPQLRRDIGELQWIGFEGTEVTASLRRRLAKDALGCVVLFRRNLPLAAGHALPATVATPVDALALRALCLELKAAAGASQLWIAIDQEGGVVQRVRAPATVWPPMLAFERVAKLRGEAVACDLAEQVGRALGDELAAVEVDVDFAPVLDIHTNDANPIIGNRAFGRTAATVAARALAFASGLAGAGIIACGKHFPGHGDTHTDSHLALPRIAHAWDRLRHVELAPFRQAAAAGLPMLMTAHVVFEALAPGVPATLAPEVVQGLLREQLGYQGIIVSDDLDMKAIADSLDVGEAAVRAIMAGCDALLLCRDQAHQATVHQALLQEAARNEAFAARVQESAARIRDVKATQARHWALAARPSLAVLGADSHQALASALNAAMASDSP